MTRRFPLAVVLAAAAAAAGVAAAADPAPGGGKRVISLRELRDEGVVRQHWDLTCGAAAVATILTFSLGHPVTEREVVATMLRRSSPELVRARLGFSLLDLKIYAATLGFGAAGYEGLSLTDLDSMAPVIVPMRWRGFRHFVVYRGRRDGRVLLADPAFGNRLLAEDLFVGHWANRVGFVVYDPAAPRTTAGPGAPAWLYPIASGQARRAAVSALGGVTAR